MKIIKTNARKRGLKFETWQERRIRESRNTYLVATTVAGILSLLAILIIYLL